MNKRHLTGILALGAAASLTLAGCSNSDSGDAQAGGSSDQCGTITLGFLPSWTDGLSMAYLLQNQLEQIGYSVEMETLTEAGPLYTGLAQGDIDVYPSAWPDITHAAYMEEYGDDLEALGTYYDDARSALAVPRYVDIDSVEDLIGNADRFGGQIIGIEPGAGLTAQTQDMLMPEYGLDSEYDLVTSSTPAMLAELGSAIADHEDIVVTSWSPSWVIDAYDLKQLEDPRDGMSETETMQLIGTAGFSDRCGDAAELIAGIHLDGPQFGSLEDMVVNEYGAGQEPEAVTAWIEANPEAFDTIVTR